MAFFDFHSRSLNVIPKIHGMAMTDVLVSILLLGITLGGAFTANNAGIQELRFLNKVTVAMEATKEISIRMNQNINSSNLDVYEINTSKVLYEIADCINGCSSVVIAQNDVHQWTSKILAAIPEARMKITIQDNMALIGILWRTANKDSQSTALCPFTKQELSDNYCMAFESVAKLND